MHFAIAAALASSLADPVLAIAADVSSAHAAKINVVLT